MSGPHLDPMPDPGPVDSDKIPPGWSPFALRSYIGRADEGVFMDFTDERDMVLWLNNAEEGWEPKRE